jgi:crotonobetainyl-CoA:carnitine CoA-transferase CaiB-like acyl-CoA transferase
MKKDGPLRGIRVLDFSRILAGPLCSLYLADLGADVLKVERPGRGDESRGYPEKAADGSSATFVALNRGKRGIAIDLQTSAGVGFAHSLASKADVLIENFRVGVMEGFGLAYQDMRIQNPALVYCTISGFGKVGPLARDGANNLIAQAFGGMLGRQSGDPLMVSSMRAVTDMYTGVNAAVAIVAALYARATTGRGCLVETSLLEAQAGLMSHHIVQSIVTGVDPISQYVPFTVPNDAFLASDDRWLVLAVNSEEMWTRFCEALGLKEWQKSSSLSKNALRMEQREHIVRRVAAIIATRPRNDWLRLFREFRVTAGPVNSVSEFIEHPQTKAMGMVSKTYGPGDLGYPAVRLPFSMSNFELGSDLPPPALRDWEKTPGDRSGIGWL